MILLVGSGPGPLRAHLTRRLAGGGFLFRTLDGEVRDPLRLWDLLTGVEQIVHLAPFPVAPLFEVAREVGVRRVISVSVMGAGPHPHFPFLHHLADQEEAVRGSGLAFTILRPSVIFGEGDDLLRPLLWWTAHSPALLALGTACTQPIWVGDVVSCLLRALEDETRDGKSWVLGGPERLTHREVLEMVVRALGVRRVLLSAPTPRGRQILSGLQRLFPLLPLFPPSWELFYADHVAEFSTLRRTWGVEPMPLAEALPYLTAPPAARRGPRRGAGTPQTPSGSQKGPRVS